MRSTRIGYRVQPKNRMAQPKEKGVDRGPATERALQGATPGPDRVPFKEEEHKEYVGANSLETRWKEEENKLRLSLEGRGEDQRFLRRLRG